MGSPVKLVVRKGKVEGAVPIPASKSHTIRGLLIGTLGSGTSQLLNPLESSDTLSCLAACEALGGRVTRRSEALWEVQGTAGRPRPAPGPVDVGNSGTTLFLAMGTAALAEGETEFTGDAQIRSRSAGPLMEALRALGARAWSKQDNDCPPLVVAGPLQGGSAIIECPTSQYLSSLLLSCPLAPGDTRLSVPLLNERPYVTMTLQWLDRVGIEYRAAEDYSRLELPGGQAYEGFRRQIPGDFSTASFFLVAAAITGSRLRLERLEMGDSQGDRAVVGMLAQMGCEVCHDDAGLTVRGPDRLEGGDFDLNATPDALPAMAVAGACAAGTTRLLNVPQARQKETDRIEVMARELARIGASVEQLPDGIILRHSRLHGGEVHGHADHRVVMALAVAGLATDEPTTVDTAEAAAVTCPGFVNLMRRIGAEVDVVR